MRTLSAFAIAAAIAALATHQIDAQVPVVLGSLLQEIQLGAPKAWRYDRLYPMLDGQLRDVEGVSLSGLTSLDASSANSRIVEMVQTLIGGGVNADQQTALTNRTSLEAFDATRSAQLANAATRSASLQMLNDRQAQLTRAYADAVGAKAKALVELPSGTTCEQNADCKQLTQTITDLNAQVTAVQALVTATTVPGISALSVTSQSGPATAGLSGLTPTLPSAEVLKAALGNESTKLVGDLPPRERLDGFLSLLSDRLMRQLSVNLDEYGLSQEYVPLIVEFTAALEPQKSRKNQKAMSRFTVTIDDPTAACRATNAQGQSVPKSVVVYNLYPAMAAFNIQDVNGASSGANFSAGLKGLFVGASLAIQRQRDRVSTAMQQSVYVSGYREGASTLGWYYGPPAFTKLVRPGTYSTFAVVLVPVRNAGNERLEPCHTTVTGQALWKDTSGRATSVPVSSTLTERAPLVPQDLPALAKSVEYFPHYGTPETLQNDVNVIAVEFERPISPTLLITASGKLLKRVRDWRGRATAPAANETVSVTDSRGNQSSISRSRGLFEADIDESDTWIAVSPTKILIKIAHGTATSSDFPDIRFLVPGQLNAGLTELVNSSKYQTTVTIGDQAFFACHPKPSAFVAGDNDGCVAQPRSMWYPLFSLVPEVGHELTVRRVNTAAVGDAPDNSGMSGQTYVFLSVDHGAVKLDQRAQVTLVSPGHSRFSRPRPIECSGLDGGLLCHLHPQTIVFSDPAGGAPGTPQCLTIQKGAIVEPGPGAPLVCNWQQYRLQIHLRQASITGRPVLNLRADYPTDPSTAAPVIGAARSVRRTAATAHGASWQFEFPVYYPSGAQSVCVVDNVRRPRAAQIVVDRTRDAGRMGTLVLDVALRTLSGLLGSPAAIYGAACPIAAGVLQLPVGDPIGVLAGIDELMLPAQAALVIKGSAATIYELSASNLDQVDRLLVGTQPVTTRITRTGLIADLDSAPARDSLLLYQIAGETFPVDACWTETMVTPDTKTIEDTDATGKTTKKSTTTTLTRTNRLCGQVVVPAARVGKPTDAAPGAGTPSTSRPTGPEQQTTAPARPRLEPEASADKGTILLLPPS